MADNGAVMNMADKTAKAAQLPTRLVIMRLDPDSAGA
jgi:hypothetical protein